MCILKNGLVIFKKQQLCALYFIILNVSQYSHVYKVDYNLKFTKQQNNIE